MMGSDVMKQMRRVRKGTCEQARQDCSILRALLTNGNGGWDPSDSVQYVTGRAFYLWMLKLQWSAPSGVGWIVSNNRLFHMRFPGWLGTSWFDSKATATRSHSLLLLLLPPVLLLCMLFSSLAFDVPVVFLSSFFFFFRFCDWSWRPSNNTITVDFLYLSEVFFVIMLWQCTAAPYNTVRFNNSESICSGFSKIFPSE